MQKLPLAILVIGIIIVGSFLAFRFAFEVTSPAPAVDTTASAVCQDSTSCSATISSTHTPLILAFYSAVQAPKGASGFSCSDSAGSSYKVRGSITSLNRFEELFYAVSSSSLSSDSVTCSFTGGIANDSVIAVVTVYGFNPSSPFDPNANLPATSSGSNSTSGSLTISTSNANDLVLGFFKADTRLQTFAPGSGFSAVVSQTGSPSEFIESNAVSSTKSSMQVSASWTNSVDWAALADAIQGVASSSSTTSSSSRASGNSGSQTTSSSSSTNSMEQQNTTSVSSTSTSGEIGFLGGNSPIQGVSMVQFIEYALLSVVISLVLALAVVLIRRQR